MKFTTEIIYSFTFESIFGLARLNFSGENNTKDNFSCDQAALQMVPSVRLSVCLSHLFDYVPIIVSSLNFQELLPMTKVRSVQKVKVRGQRSRSQVTTQLNRFRTVTPVSMHVWWWNDAYGLMLLRRGALLFFKVIRQIPRSHGSKNRRIWPRLGVSGR